MSKIVFLLIFVGLFTACSPLEQSTVVESPTPVQIAVPESVPSVTGYHISWIEFSVPNAESIVLSNSNEQVNLTAQTEENGEIIIHTISLNDSVVCVYLENKVYHTNSAKNFLSSYTSFCNTDGNFYLHGDWVVVGESSFDILSVEALAIPITVESIQLLGPAFPWGNVAVIITDPDESKSIRYRVIADNNLLCQATSRDGKIFSDQEGIRGSCGWDYFASPEHSPFYASAILKIR